MDPYPSECANYTYRTGACVTNQEPEITTDNKTLAECCELTDQFKYHAYQYNETDGGCQLYQHMVIVNDQCPKTIITAWAADTYPEVCDNYAP